MVTVRAARYGSEPLPEGVSLHDASGPSAINRVNRQRQVGIQSNVAPGYGESDVQIALEKIIAAEHLPATSSALPQGRSKETGKAALNFLLAFALSFIFMYLVLAAQFESWLHPITILLTLPLTLPFAFLSVILFRQAIDIYSVLGILVLFAFVKNTPILHIHHTNHLPPPTIPPLTP